MPNNLINKLHFSGEQSRIDKLLELIKGENTVFDFNKVIPMPESLDIEAGNRTDNGLKAYNDFVDVYTMGDTLERDLLHIPKEKEEIFLKSRPDIMPGEWELGKIAFQNERQYGVSNWYDWRIEKWGSKWAAFNAEIADDNSIEFNTAWSNVKPVILALSQKFPDVEMKYQWADEDIGCNMGEVTFKDGEYVDNIEFEAFSKEAFEFAAEMWGFDLEEEGFIFDEKSGTYEWQDFETADSPIMG